MSATSCVRGRFAAITHKSWETFTDQRSGEIVNGGQSAVIHVVDSDGELDSVKVPAEKVPEVLDALRSLEFGDPVELEVKVNRYGLSYKSLTVG